MITMASELIFGRANSGSGESTTRLFDKDALWNIGSQMNRYLAVWDSMRPYEARASAKRHQNGSPKVSSQKPPIESWSLSPFDL